MDYLRYAYSTYIYSFDPVTQELVPTTITWCKAPTGAQPIGVRHQYASSVWTRPTAYKELVGEIIEQNRTYSKGQTPPGLSGTNWCGSDWTGKLERLTIPLLDNSDGQPACCDHQNPPYMGCPDCPGGAANQWTVNATGFTGGFAVLNGVWIASAVAQCVWENTGAPHFTFERAGLGFALILDDDAGNSVTYLSSSYSCLGPNVVSFSHSTGGPGGAPSQLTVSRYS